MTISGSSRIIARPIVWALRSIPGRSCRVLTADGLVARMRLDRGRCLPAVLVFVATGATSFAEAG